MKDLSGYIESILCGRLPNSRVDVYLVDQRYVICMDVYEIRRERTGDDFLKLMITEVIDSELNIYFPTEVPKHKKIVQVYEHEYR